MSITLKTLVDALGGELVGNDVHVDRVSSIANSGAGSITFIVDSKYRNDLANTKASAVILAKENQALTDLPCIVVSNPYAYFAQVSALLNPKVLPVEGVHPSAVVDQSVSVPASCSIGANTVIAKGVVLADGVVLGAGCYLGENVSIGQHTELQANVTVYADCHIGQHCVIASGATIGADGFGFRPDPQKGLVKIPQIGNVVIGNGVEIGANSCVDRGKFSSTVLGDGCKIDNLVQIGHNSKLGRFCIMAGNSGLAGSVTLGNGVIIGGSASIKDHTTLGDGAIVGAGSGVVGDVAAGKTVLGYPAVDARDALKQWAILKRLVEDSKNK